MMLNGLNHGVKILLFSMIRFCFIFCGVCNIWRQVYANYTRMILQLAFLSIFLNFKPVFGPYSMVLWIACASLFTVYMVFCLPDTRGKTPEQVQLELDGPFIKRKFFGVSTRQFRQRIFEKPLNAPVDVFHVT